MSLVLACNREILITHLSLSSAKTATNIQELFLDLIRQINQTISVSQKKAGGAKPKSGGGGCALL